MIKTVPQLISPKYFFIKLLRPNSYKNRSLILENLEKSWETMQNKIGMQLLAT